LLNLAVDNEVPERLVHAHVREPDARHRRQRHRTQRATAHRDHAAERERRDLLELRVGQRVRAHHARRADADPHGRVPDVGPPPHRVGSPTSSRSAPVSGSLVTFTPTSALIAICVTFSPFSVNVAIRSPTVSLSSPAFASTYGGTLALSSTESYSVPMSPYG